MQTLVSSATQSFLRLAFRSSSSLLSRTPTCSFARLSEQTDDGKPKYTKSKEYYEYLLRFTPPNERGYLKFNSQDLNELVRLARDEEDIKSVRTAYYNFLGHKVTFSNSQIDKFLEKAISLSCVPLTHEILHNHNYLMYYPHTSTLNNIAAHYLTTSNVDGMTEFAKIFTNAHFLKIDATTLESAATLGLSAQNN